MKKLIYLTFMMSFVMFAFVGCENGIESEPIGHISHTWNEGTVIKAAACETDGIKKYTCTVCGETKTEKIFRSHSWDEKEVLYSGIKFVTCSVCGKSTSRVFVDYNGAISVNIDNAADVIKGLDIEKNKGCYTVVITGELGDELEKRNFDKIRNALMTSGYVGPYEGFYGVNLDLSELKGFSEEMNKWEPRWPITFNNCNMLLGIILPDGLENIGEDTFSECRNLCSITIPSSVKTIKKMAFHGCGFSELVLPENLENIEEKAFDNCNNLQRVIIPKTVKNISPNAFSFNPIILDEIIIDEENETYKSVDGKMILSKDGKTLVCCPTPSRNIVIPDSVKTIGVKSFFEVYRCPPRIIIPKTVEDIENEAFFGCDIGEFEMEASVPPKIGYNSFDYNNVRSIYVPFEAVSAYKNASGWADYSDKIKPNHLDCIHSSDGSIEKINDLTVYTCFVCGRKFTDNGETVFFVTPSLISSMDDYDFTLLLSFLPDDTTVYFMGEYDGIPISSYAAKKPDFSYAIGITEIPYRCFTSQKQLKSVKLPNGLERIIDSAFRKCSNLESIYIPSSVIQIDQYPGTWNFFDQDFDEGQSFDFCEKVKFFVDENNPVFFSSDDNTFLFCRSGNDIILVSGASASGDVVIPDGVTAIGYAAFVSNEKITSMTLPDSVTTIYNNAFKGCYNLSSIKLSNSLEKIGTDAFYCCYKLRFNIGNDNTNFSTSDDGAMLLSKDGKRLLSYPSASGTVSIPNTIETISSGVFNDSDIYSYIFEYRIDILDKLENVLLHSSLFESIVMESTEPPLLGEDNFKDCAFLKKIYVPAESINKYKTAPNWSDYAHLITSVNAIKN